MILLSKKMEFYISQETLNSFDETIYKINLDLLKKIHKKFLKDLDFNELKVFLDGIEKKKYYIEENFDNKS